MPGVGQTVSMTFMLARRVKNRRRMSVEVISMTARMRFDFPQVQAKTGQMKGLPTGVGFRPMDGQLQRHESRLTRAADVVDRPTCR